MGVRYEIYPAAPRANVIGWWVRWNDELFSGSNAFPSVVEAIEYIKAEAAEDDRPVIYPLSVSPLAVDVDVEKLRKRLREQDRLKSWATRIAAKIEAKEAAR
jgi:hypothetical protein